MTVMIYTSSICMEDILLAYITDTETLSLARRFVITIHRKLYL